MIGNVLIILFAIFFGFLFGAVYFYVNREFYDYADKVADELEKIIRPRAGKKASP